MQVRVARIFNTYGPRMHMNDGRVVSNFILQALKEDLITVGWVTVLIIEFYRKTYRNIDQKYSEDMFNIN